MPFQFLSSVNRTLLFLESVQGINTIGCFDNWFYVCIHQAFHMGWRLMAIKFTLPDKTIGHIWDHWPSYISPVTGTGADSGPNHGNHPLSLYCWLRMWKWLSSPDPQNAECHILWHAYLKHGGGHKFCKVYKPHHSFSSKLFELLPKSGVSHSSTRKAMALPWLNPPTASKSMIM